MHTLILESVMGCHGNHAFSHSPKSRFFLGRLCFAFRGPNEQFGAHVLEEGRGA